MDSTLGIMPEVPASMASPIALSAPVTPDFFCSTRSSDSRTPSTTPYARGGAGGTHRCTGHREPAPSAHPIAYPTSVSCPVKLSVVSPLLAKRTAFTVPSRTVRAIGTPSADEVNAVTRPCSDCDTAPSSRPTATAHPRAGAMVIVMGRCDSHDRDPSPSDCGPCSDSPRSSSPN